MSSQNFKYLALVTELPALMIALGYAFQWLDESYELLGGYGMVFGIVLALAAWIMHATYLMKNSTDDTSAN